MVPETGGKPTGPATLAVAQDPTLGPILVDDRGMTLYMFTKDEPNKSNCAGGCLKAWPPFLTDGTPVAGEGVDATLIGTTAMADGSTIVTYNEMPLYYWASDAKAGDTTGQGVNNVWYVVAPDGKPVGMPQSSVNSADDDY
jgi:predicted lipoprotein with Yx(FWY)xxD motif